MQKIRIKLNRGVSAVIAVLFMALLGGANLGLFGGGVAFADNLTSRKVTVSSSAKGSISTNAAGQAVPAGEGGNGAKANHTFSFTLPTTGNVGSVKFKYCTTAFGACTAPTGLDASTLATMASSTGWSGSFPLSLDTSTNLTSGDAECVGSGNGRTNCIAVKKGTADSESTGARTVGFGTGGGTDWIKNPTSVGDYYVRIQLYATTAYGTPGDSGNVMFAIVDQVNITTKVQETLNFSVANTPVDPSTSCVALSGGGNIFLGDVTNHVLDFTQAYDNHTYFRLSTNSANGVVVQYSGDTLKSGSESIDVAGTAGPTPEASTVGAEQFGIGIDSADATAFGYSFTNLSASAPYSTGNGTITNGGTASFYFDTASKTAPITVASSANVVICDTGSVRYLANISPNTAAGVYTTTITYIATPTY